MTTTMKKKRAATDMATDMATMAATATAMAATTVTVATATCTAWGGGTLTTRTEGETKRTPLGLSARQRKELREQGEASRTLDQFFAAVEQ